MAAQGENHLDKIFTIIGQWKPFTIYQILTISMVSLPGAYQLLSNVFICRGVPHRCASSPNDSSVLLSGLDGYDYSDLSISYQQCHIVVSFNDTVLKTEECIYGMAYDKPRDVSVVSQFDLVCDYSSLARLSQTLVIAGQGIGAAFFTFLSDKLGRKPIAVFSNMGLLVSGLVIAYAPNYTVFAIFKFLAGAFQQGAVTSFSTLIMEILTAKNRRVQACYSGCIWGFSCMSLALWAYVFSDSSWRTLQMVLSLFALPAFFQMWYTRESLRWLIANGKSKAVVAYIRYATKLNKTSYEHAIQAYEDVCHLQHGEMEKAEGKGKHYKGTATKKLTLIDILKIPRLFVNTAIMWFAWFTTALCFFAIYLMSTSLAGDPYLNFFLIALMEIPNNFVLFYFLNKFGRKTTLFTVFFTVAIGLIVCGIFRSLEQNSLNAVFALVFSCLGMTGTSAGFAMVYFFTKEIFPTNVRNQALGVSSFMGRVGGMIAPFIGILGEKAMWAPGLMMGCCALIVCLLTRVLPETRGRELPQKLEDVLAWYSKGNNPINLDVTDRNDEDKDKMMNRKHDDDVE